VIAVIIAAALLGPAAGAAMAEANFLGTWIPNTGVAWTITSQSGGSCTGTSADAGFEFTGCHVSGNNYEFTVSEGGYSSYNHGTITGNTLEGVFEDPGVHPYTAVREGAGNGVGGKILDRQGKPAVGVKLALTGTSDESAAVSLSTTTDAEGHYKFEVPPGNYAVTASGEPKDQIGGTLAVAEEKGTPFCTGKPSGASCNLDHIANGEEGLANFTYTDCSSEAKTVEGKEPTGCPIIFIPGILGSRVFCGATELFLSAPVHFNEMQLEPDGKTNKPGACNATAGTPEGEAGVLTSAYGHDAYGGMLKFLNRIATNGVYPFPYDWRKSVPEASADLGRVVAKTLKETGATHVVLAAHSMGGLVLQNYIADSSNAKNVVRAITIGTPYWGAPKSIIALLKGYANEFSLEGLDALLGGPDGVQQAVRNYAGLFWLYPSAAFGPWLQIDAPGYPNLPVGGTAIDQWVQSLGGTAALVDAAESGHAAIDSFKTNEVNYQIMVGVGLPTITRLEIKVNELEPEQVVELNYGSGDGTVPARSQTEGAFPGTAGSGGVPIHYVCGVEHSKEPGNEGVQGRIQKFLLAGEAIEDPSGTSPTDCPYGGSEIVLSSYITNHGVPPTAGAVIDALPSAGAAMTLAQAIAQQRVQVLELGGRTIITTSSREPVTLKLSGSGLGVRVRSIGNDTLGAPAYYGPLSGQITIGPTGTVMRGAKKLRPGKGAGTPHVIAHVSRRGRRYLVRLTRSGHSVAAIYTRIGKGTRKRYSKPLLLTGAQLKKLRFAGVSAFGVWESPQRARPPR
jgi:pimeloyl-ACP methyl ester carboxylesterase